jgi:hypothetical protein
MTQFDRSYRSEILHNWMKSETMHESADKINNFAYIRNFDIKKCDKYFFSIFTNTIRNSSYICNIQGVGCYICTPEVLSSKSNF